MKHQLIEAIHKFELNLSGKIVLTEAASGNYVCTPLLAALAGANVYAFGKDSEFGTYSEVKKELMEFAIKLKINDKINIINNFNHVPLEEMNIVTNTGFLRPINRILINRLSSECVIPLMWEPWEHRPAELDIEACVEKGIKVYGTNESDERLRTFEYIGYIVLYWLLHFKLSPFSAKILILGNHEFVEPIKSVLQKLNYYFKVITDYNSNVNIKDFNCIVIAEYKSDKMIIGDDAVIHIDSITDQKIIHISGNVCLNDYKYCIPKNPKVFPYMSFTTDFIDKKAVIDLHAAGLKVAEGLLNANMLGLKGLEYKDFMEKNYPALSFSKKKFW